MLHQRRAKFQQPSKGGHLHHLFPSTNHIVVEASSVQRSKYAFATLLLHSKQFIKNFKLTTNDILCSFQRHPVNFEVAGTFLHKH